MMKVLHFALITPTSPQWGLRKALVRLAGAEEYYREFNWYPYYARGDLSDMRMAFLDQARGFGPSVIFAQVQTDDLLPHNLLNQIRRSGPWIMQWCGDLRNETPTWAWKIAPHVDLNCFSNLRDVENLRMKGHPAEFLNIGFSTEVFCPAGRVREGTPEIVFLGSNYANSAPFPRSHQRQQMVAHLRKRYGSRFAVHGTGWGNNDEFLLEEEEAACYRACKIAINQNHYDTVPAFSSDRIFRSMGSGAFVVSNIWPKMEADFKDGEHLVTWKPGDFDHLCEQIDFYLNREDERKKIAAAGCRHVHANHSWDARMSRIQDFMRKYPRKEID